MQQETVANYIVGAGEEVTVEIVAIETANTATFVVDTPSNRVSEDPITYFFTVTKGPGQTHFSEVRGAFHGPPPANPVSDPRFEVFLTGSLGGGRLTGPVIRRSDPDHIRDITFDRPEED
jgi:hypothetical protein